MRTKASVLSGLVTAFAVLVAASLAAAQAPEYEQFERPEPQAPVEGFARGDGTLILKDADFCSYLLGSIWGDDELTFAALIDRSKRQRKALKAAFRPLTDEVVLQRCADVLNAFRLAPPEGDTLAAWARSGPVVPEALAGLLPADFLTDPLAEPAPIGDGSRTTGYGDLFSAPFGLTGGTYFAQVNAGTCAAWSGTLRGARDPSLDLGSVDGKGYFYDVPPANYYWDITAPECDWSVDLVAVDLGPEPTATPVPKAVVPRLVGDQWRRNERNPEYLEATTARAAVLAAGLEIGACTHAESPPIWPQLVWQQDPAPGTLVEFGSTVDVWIGVDCEILTGERIAG